MKRYTEEEIREMQERFKALKQLSPLLLTLKMKKTNSRKCKWPLEAEKNFWPTASKEMDTSMEVKVVSNLSKIGSRFILRAPKKEIQPWHFFSLVRFSKQNIQLSQPNI